MTLYGEAGIKQVNSSAQTQRISVCLDGGQTSAELVEATLSEMDFAVERMP
jgi:hypothetical protein